MARKSKNGAAEALIDIVARLPWWAGLLLAVVSCFVLHRLAIQPAAASLQPGHAGTFMTQNGVKAFATYLLPLMCVVGAGFSAWRRRERKTLVQNIVRSESADALNDMSWQQFEKLVGEGFRLQGYTVSETSGGGADGGIDLVLARGGEKFLVQCKQWRALKVGVDVVRELDTGTLSDTCATAARRLPELRAGVVEIGRACGRAACNALSLPEWRRDRARRVQAHDGPWAAYGGQCADRAHQEGPAEHRLATRQGQVQIAASCAALRFSRPVARG